MPGSVIVSGARTPIGKFGGGLAGLPAVNLGGIAIRAALERAGVPASEVDYVIMGQVLQAGAGQITARQAAVAAGIPIEVPALTINKVCLSGLNALALADQLIAMGDAEIVVAGGQESMTNAPYLVRKARWGLRMGNEAFVDSMLNDGLLDPDTGQHMGITAENVAEQWDVSREDMDRFAQQSQERAVAAQESGFFEREITPWDGVANDDGPRPDSTLEKLSQLEPAFKPGGKVTAGNSCPLNDGAAAVVVMSDTRARELGITPLARIVASSVAGVAPEIMGVGPIEAVRKVLEQAGMTIDEVDVVELNEAFAAQVLPVCRELGIDPFGDKLNPHGGAIALGHPYGMTGARIMNTLLNDLRTLDRTIGVETMCVGGGQGMAMIVERLD